MSNTGDGNSKSVDSQLDEVLAAYVHACEDGSPPNREELVSKYPQMADELAEFFRHRDNMQELLDPLRDAATRVLNIRCPHCRNSVELVDDAPVSSISCPSCGSNFSLVSTTSTGRLPFGIKRLGQFQLIEQVGVGQFGSVWKARDLTLERTVAIKIPRSGQLTESETEMFLRDARLAAQIKHPNIVGVHEVGKQDDTIYMVSDFIQGATLKDWTAAKRLTPGESAELCIKLGQALHHAHEAGIVHRDLKPGNIMIDLQGEPHVVDFGLAKRDGGEITMTVEGQILGTPAYMSPEQARGEGHHVDRRADIYSLGVILFELLTAELPFRGDKPMLIVQILSEDPPSPRKLDNAVPRDLETICLKCLRKDPSNRYQTAAALADDLRRWLGRQPIVARPVGRREKLWLWCRRRPAISFLLALLVVVVFGAALILREVQQRERADGLVSQLMTADVVESPRIITQLLPYIHRVESRLREESNKAEKEGNVNAQLLASLARFRLYGDNRQTDRLYQRLLTATPAEFPVLCQALSSRRDHFVEPLWALALAPESDAHRRFRACCALASLDANNDRWENVVPFVTDQLVAVPLAHLGPWREQLRTVHQQLLKPLENILRNEGEWIQKRNFAADILANYLADQPEELFRLLMESGEQQFREFLPALATHRVEFVPLLAEELDKRLPESARESQAERFARRRAIGAIAAYQMNLGEMAAPVLRRSPDPRARTRFIHWAAPFGVDPRAIISRLKHETDDSVRQALVLTLGEFKTVQLSVAERNQLVPLLLDTYRNGSHAGLHGAVEWLLRHWGFGETVQEAVDQLQVREQRWREASRDVTEQNGWFVNTQGHTMIQLDADEFLMGAHDSLPIEIVVNRPAPIDRPRHRVVIGRKFAIASKELTREQWERFLADQVWTNALHEPNDYSAAADCPQNRITWYEAAAYCNWLSQQEGIGQAQWAYRSNADGKYAEGLQTHPDFPACQGYRLPTEAEWEFACRAGTVTFRFYGASDDFLSRYACSVTDRTSPVGHFKANDFGLFDMFGNVLEWCHDRWQPYPKEPGDTPYMDRQSGGEQVKDSRRRTMRGGHFGHGPNRLDSADRSRGYRPTTRYLGLGFRVAQTVVAAPHDLAPGRWDKAHQLGRQGKWREAAELMQETIPQLAGSSAHWYELHSVWHFLGEMEQVNAISDEMLRRFGDTKDPDVAHRLAYISLVVPDREVTERVQQITELSVTDRNPTHYRDMGIMCFRRNEFEEAEKWLVKATHSYLPGKPPTLYYLAMVRQKRGNKRGAQEALREAHHYRDQIRASFSPGDYGKKWNVWLIIETVRRQAQQIVSEKPSH